jgi:hypothetical protein
MGRGAGRARRGGGVLVAILCLACGLEGRAAAQSPDAAGPDPGEQPVKQLGQVVDMVVAQVDSTVITLSELLAETRLVLLRTHGPERARTLPLGRDLLRAVLRAMVTRELMLAEARRLQLREVPQGEVEAAVRKIRDRFGSLGDYVRFMERVGFTVPSPGSAGGTPVPPVLEAILRAERLVERFIALRVRSNAPVRPERAKACYLRHRDRLGGRSFEDARPVVEQVLREERAERTLRALITELEARATIRYAPDFKPSGGLLEDAEVEGDTPLGLRCGDGDEGAP